VQHRGQVIGIGHECLGHQTVNLKRSSLQSHAAVAFAVVGSYAAPCVGVALGIGGAQHVAVAGDEVEGAALLPELFVITIFHIASVTLFNFYLIAAGALQVDKAFTQTFHIAVATQQYYLMVASILDNYFYQIVLIKLCYFHIVVILIIVT
jgi:hypothetical protein